MSLRSGAASDLNQVVAERGRFGIGAGISVIKEMSELPKVILDREKSGKGHHNLVLNAKEAMSGTVRFGSRQDRKTAGSCSRSRQGVRQGPEFIIRLVFRFPDNEENGSASACPK